MDNLVNKELAYIKAEIAELSGFDYMTKSETDCDRFVLRVEILIDICQNHLDDLAPNELTDLLDIAGHVCSVYHTNEVIGLNYVLALALYCIITRRHLKLRRETMLRQRFLATDNDDSDGGVEKEWLIKNGEREKQERESAEKYRLLLIRLYENKLAAVCRQNDYVSISDCIKENHLDVPISLPGEEVTTPFDDINQICNQGEKVSSILAFHGDIKVMKEYLLSLDYEAVESLFRAEHGNFMETLWQALKELIFSEYPAGFLSSYEMYSLTDKLLSVKAGTLKKRYNRENLYILQVEASDILRDIRAKALTPEDWNNRKYTPTRQGYNHLNIYNGVLTQSIGSTILEIPDDVVCIGKKAFGGNTRHIIWPKGLKHIAYRAFDRCDLTAAALPPDVTLEERSFLKCKHLNTAFIPLGTNSIPSRAFEECTIENIVLPDSVTDIGDAAFYMNPIRSLELPAKLKTIGHNAFYSGAMDRIHLPDSLIMSDETEGVFWGCHNLNEVTFPKGITEIPGYTFGYCGFEALTIPESVVYIGQEAFTNCKLASVIMPDGLEEIGDWAFSYNPF